LHEAGTKFAVESKKIGDRYPQIPWATEFGRIAADKENIEKSRFELQSTIWDAEILAFMNCAESDQKDLQVHPSVHLYFQYYRQQNAV